MEPGASAEVIVPWLWAIPVLPLLGFLINAIIGARLTKSPRPVVAPPSGACVHNAVAADAPEFTPDAGVTAAGPDAYDMDRVAEEDAAHGAHDSHGADVHLDAGGTKLVGGLATLLVFAAFALSLFALFTVNGISGEEKRIFSTAFTWMSIPASPVPDVSPLAAIPQALNVSFRLAVDPLTALMLCIITGVGGLIHLYSTGYMAHDKGYARYFAYLNLFVFFMLLLVMGSNLVVLFVGWEGVGLASYLLINYFYERKAAGDAAKKAFIVNRVGDAFFLLGLFLIYRYFGTFEMFGQGGILTRAAANDLPAEYLVPGLAGAVNLVPLFLFLGATGKSAQIPLYVWLPDAMEGPTPVSALIHAATMVTAGVFLLARTHTLFLLSPGVMTVVAVIGVSTAFLAATIAFVQNDIKKVMAYSTVSQLGYMFLACGVGAFGAAMFHVFTHAFFKAVLFLGSGSVIHAMGGEQDMRRMGGLKAKLPATHWTMLAGALALSGVPIFAGFFSKDEILANAFAGPAQNGLGHPLLWLTGWVIAGMTAFYTFRMMSKTFYGRPRYTEEVAAHIHESPASMTIPLWILGALSVVAGFAGGFAPLHIASPFEHFLGSTVEWRAEGAELNLGATEWVLVIASILVAVGGAYWAYSSYLKARDAERLTPAQKAHSWLYGRLDNKWGVDDAYNGLFVREGKRLSNFLWRFVDVRMIDGAVNGVAGGIAALSQALRGWQSGYVRSYALSMLIGVLIVVLGSLWLALRAFAG
jgi:NADH-quinone oxidoreductase subunit L